MKGLIIKDLYFLALSNKYSLPTLLASVFCIFCIDSIFLILMSYGWLSLILLTIKCTSEEMKWRRYETCLPRSEKSVVLSKYIIDVSFKIILMVLIVIAKIARYFILDKHMSLNNALLSLLLVFIFDITAYLIIPFIFKRGEKAGIALVAVYAFVLGFLNGFLESFSVVVQPMSIAVTAVIWAVVIAVSYCRTIKFYQRNDHA